MAAIPGIWGCVAHYARWMNDRARRSRLTAAVTRIDSREMGDRALRVALLDLIQDVVPFDAYAFLLTDPTTSVGCSPVADAPDLTTLPNLIRLKYLTPVNRWTALPASGTATLQQATGGRPEESLVWREHLARLGIVDVVSVVFADRFGCWGFLDLWRRASRFTDDELVTLTDVRAEITALLRGVQAASFTAPALPPGPRGPGALVLSPALAILAQTAQTERWLTALVPAQGGRSPVPASAYNVAAQLLAIEAGVDAHPAQARVHLGGGAWLTLRADRLGDSRAGADGEDSEGTLSSEERNIVVTMEASSPTERRDIFCRSHGLTGRETEVLRHLGDGSDTRTVAQAMSISELTVQDHLKAIFTKTSTSSRRELLAVSSGS